MDTPVVRSQADADRLAIRLMVLFAIAVWIALGAWAASMARREERACRARGGFPEYADGYTVRCHMRGNVGNARELE